MRPSLRVGIGAVLLLLLFAGLVEPAAAGKHDGRIRRDAVHDWLLVLREPVDDPDETPTAWVTANACLAKIGPDDRVVLPELIARLQDPVPRVRAAAADAIGRMGPEAKNAVPALRGLLARPIQEGTADCLAMQSAITALGQIGDDAVSAADDLVLRFNQVPDFKIQQSLLRFGPAALPALARGLQDSHPEIRLGCLTALASLNCPAADCPTPHCSTASVVERELELLADQTEVNSQRGCLGCNIPVGRAAVSAIVRRGAPLIEPLRKRLASGNPVIRVRAASALAQLKVFDQPVVDRLAEGYRQANLVDEVTTVVNSADRAKDPQLLAALRSLLTDREAGVRDCAASALIGLGAVDDNVVQTEIGLLSQLEFSYQAADFLARSRPRVRPFAPQLAQIARQGKMQHARWVAAGLLACTTPEDPAIAVNLAEIQQKVRSKDEMLQHYGALATYLMGEKGFPTLCQFLHQNQIFGLPDFVSPQKDFDKRLIAEIRRAAVERDRSWHYVSLLLELASTNCSGDALAPCLPILIEHMCPPRTMAFPDPGNDPAAACLAKCAKAALPALLGKLRDREISGERLNAVIACLSRLGPAARDALPVLLSSEMRGRVDSPLALVQAIEKIGPTAECLPFLLEMESTEQFAGCNTGALVSLGDRALPGIVHLLESERRSTRQAGAFLMFQLGKKGDCAIPDIIKSLARSDGDDGELVRLLATFGPPARAAVPVVAARLNSRYVRTRSAACLALARIAAGSSEARAAVIARLLAATNDDFAEVRAAAADALGLLGTPDAAVRKALEPLRQDSFATVRNAAERALHSGDARYGAQSKVWTLYFDSSGPATGVLFSAND